MSNEQTGNPQVPNGMNNHDGFEHDDLRPRGVFYFMAGLAVVVIAIYLIVFGMYHFLDSYEMAHQPAMSPMVKPEADTRTVTHDSTQSFPQPRLEENERSQLRQIIEEQNRQLATYQWVDKDKGVAQIPIDRAMELVAERGLPVRQGNLTSETSDGAQPSATATKQSPKTPAGKAAANHGN